MKGPGRLEPSAVSVVALPLFVTPVSGLDFGCVQMFVCVVAALALGEQLFPLSILRFQIFLKFLVLLFS